MQPSSPRHRHVGVRDEARQRHRAAGQLVSGPDHAHEAVAQQRLHPQLGLDQLDHADVEIDPPIAKRRRVFVPLGREAQAKARGLALRRRCQGRDEHRGDRVGAADLDRARDLVERGRGGRMEDGVGLGRHRVDAVAERHGERRGDQPSARPDQQRIPQRIAQATERAAHRRRGHVDPARRVRHAGLLKQRVERVEQVEILDCRHRQGVFTKVALELNPFPGQPAVMAIPFKTFYAHHFLREHQHPLTVALHVIGTVAGLAYPPLIFLFGWSPWLVLGFPAVHALPGLLAHRLVERNADVGDLRFTRSDFPPHWFIAANHLLTAQLVLRRLRRPR
jgi:hypothetical protein